jgi:hypothetical protein
MEVTFNPIALVKAYSRFEVYTVVTMKNIVLCRRVALVRTYVSEEHITTKNQRSRKNVNSNQQLKGTAKKLL